MEEGEIITTRRLEALTDGIFAFSMTLLVIFIETPKAHHLTNPQQFQLYLVEQYPQFVSYLITFLLLANFWIIHHRISRFIIRTNYLNLWLNIVFMLFIVLLPFTSMIVGDFPKSWGSIFLFVSNLFFICNLLLLIWLYASHHRRLIRPDIDQFSEESIISQLIIGAFVSFLSILLSFFNRSLALYVYLLIPFFLILNKVRN
ncbi:MAG: TMEM175 family protein [Patescibacteria group bacterium]|nr:TMEM175 family protein [Patescibacteria group bacterium]